MRRYWLGFGAVSVGLTIFACSSFGSDPSTPLSEAGDDDDDSSIVRPDGAVSDDGGGPDAALSSFCTAGDAGFYCSDFEQGATEAETLFPSPSLGFGTAGDSGAVTLVSIDGSTGGGAPHAADIAIQTRDAAGPWSEYIRVDMGGTDAVSCTFDIAIMAAPGTEAFDVIHFTTHQTMPTPDASYPDGVKITIAPSTATDAVFPVQLRTDSTDLKGLGTMPTGVFKTMTVDIVANGTASASQGGGSVQVVKLGPHAVVDRLDIGILRKTGAVIRVDHLRCRK